MKTVLIHSGGLDSTVLLYQLREEGNEVLALSVDYGQRHRKELAFAADITQQLRVRHEIANLRGIGALLGSSSLTSNLPVAEGHYTEDSMKSTVVPNRNMIMLAIATGWAITEKADSVSYAAHAGDHAIYPDCREEFTNAMDAAIRLADWHEVSLKRPFVSLSKADIVRRGAELRVPFSQTWSCYQGADQHCGRCGTCIERREAFHLADVPDPTVYGPNAPERSVMIERGWRL